MRYFSPIAGSRRRLTAVSRSRGFVVAGAVTLFAGLLPFVAATPASASSCVTAANPIVCENALPGTPMDEWYSEFNYGNIQGYPNQISYQAGDTVSFKVQSPVTYTIDIYRLGWYGGDGARLMPTSPTQTFPVKTQPACISQASTGLVDCGNWSVTATWTVPSDAVSGVYIADLGQTNNDGEMTVPFVVRNNASHSDIVVQTDDETWEAYNQWTGANLYQGNGPALDGRAYAVSYNRPMNTGGDNGIYGSEFPMIEWLERNGYNVSYLSGLDVATNGSLLLNHKVFMSSGHDEYWTAQQMQNVLAARKAGVNLAFFSGQTAFWETRFGPSIDGSNTPNRNMYAYKMTKMELNPPDGIADPSGTWTGAFSDPAGASLGDPGPENQMTGSTWVANGYRSDSMTVPAAYSKLPMWAHTSVASLQPGQVTTFPAGTLGYEWDQDTLNASRPSGEIDLSSTTINITNGTFVQDYGNTFGDGTGTQSLIMYRDPTSGALVFGTATVQWSWGLATTHTLDELNANPPQVQDMQQATVNVLAEMGVQPGTLQSNLVAAAVSTDTTGPSVAITSPSAGASLPVLSPVTITGTASDTDGGVVSRVEVSSDGGQTWQPATWGSDASTVSWSYSWTPTTMGATTVEVRAENGNAFIGPVQNLSVTVGPQQCPCTMFTATSAPAVPDIGDPSHITVGVKFQATQAGYITGIRFYKSSANTGTHVGSLWTASGTLLASGTFANETASGWQQMNFAQPVPVKANTTYIASYFAPNGNYSADNQYFATQGAGLAPIQAPESTASSPNGVYAYASTNTFPNQSYENTNYWVDAVMTTSGVTTTPPAVTTQSPAPNATGANPTAPVTATFNTNIDPTTLAFTLTDSSGNPVPASVTYNSSTDTATLTPSSTLALATVYTASVSASDLFGNAMTQPATWSFTTSTTEPAPQCPCSLWGTGFTPSPVSSGGDSNSIEAGVSFQSAVSGQATGVSFYKAPNDTGTHTGTLWTSSGTQLATGTFTNETASGWQTLTFSSPVTIQANTTYVVSVHYSGGNYAYTNNYFATAHSTYPLTAMATSNGLYAYSSSTTFPTNSYASTNYWVDVVFNASTPSQNPNAGPSEPG
jgi:Domain of unknown function (DUF4082)/Bacterial Ig-like domain/Bacterial Ig domain